MKSMYMMFLAGSFQVILKDTFGLQRNFSENKGKIRKRRISNKMHIFKKVHMAFFSKEIPTLGIQIYLINSLFKYLSFAFNCT